MGCERFDAPFARCRTRYELSTEAVQCSTRRRLLSQYILGVRAKSSAMSRQLNNVFAAYRREARPRMQHFLLARLDVGLFLEVLWPRVDDGKFICRVKQTGKKSLYPSPFSLPLFSPSLPSLSPSLPPPSLFTLPPSLSLSLSSPSFPPPSLSVRV